MPTGLFTLTQVNQAIRQGAWTGYIAPTWVEYLIVAGGGGGFSGGGGGGGLLSGVVTVLANTSYTVTVGAGGTGGASQTNGANSVFGSIAATGGGKGAIVSAGTSASGGSGGGGVSGVNNGSTSGGIGGQGISSQGNRGGKGFAGSATAAGGGGGAGTVGLDAPASNVAGNGGAGIASDISGTRTTYAGGGGGGAGSTSTPGAGGVGGGGAGANTNATSGGSNTGGGGGGIYDTSTGGNGGSGIVIIRYPGTVQFFTGGTLSYANGYVIHTFYTSGTLAPTTPTPYVAADYQISRSLRFNSADSAYLNRTPASAGNLKTWTWSGWVKRSALGARQGLMVTTNAGATDYFVFEFDAYDRFFVQGRRAADSLSSIVLPTVAVYRDTSAWYHVVLSFDTTQATASDRVKAYINGLQATFNSTEPNFAYPAQNTEYRVNTTNSHAIGSFDLLNILYLNGYMTEVNFIDGQALTPSSFGYYDFNTGVWTPMKYVGTYGTNGFYLNFSDNSNTTATTLGKDYSGNGNNWTPNNFSVSAGAGNDSLVDVPTPWGTDTGVGGTVRGNYCTLNPVNAASSGVSLVNGNLDATTSASAGIAYATFGASTGKWYWEVTPGAGSDWMIGISKEGGLFDFRTTNGFAYYSNGQKFTNNTGSSYGSAFGTSNVIGVGLDMDSGTVTFYKDGVSQGVAFSGLSGTFFPSLQNPGAGTVGYTFNFGQRPFAYTAPSGFKALCTQNLPTPTIGATASTQAGKYFNTVLWTGNSTPRSITGVGFQPDLVWARLRDTTSDYGLFDAVRGATKRVRSNTTDAEDTISGVTSFDADGFSLGTSYNGSPWLYVGWNWKANGAGVSNTAGSITSTVSANTTSGFSVVTYSGNSTLGATVGHGLGTAPKMIIVKSRSGATNWPVYHASIGNTKAIFLNLTNATDTDNYWNNTSPTSTVFSLNASTGLNSTGSNYVAYCFAEVPGFSKFGSYTGNGSSTDGPFVFCGFRPAYVVVKRTEGTSTDYVWWAQDNKRGPYNATAGLLALNNVDAENSSALMDFVSNGFKIRNASGSVNANGSNYIFMAFAEAPQKFALAR